VTIASREPKKMGVLHESSTFVSHAALVTLAEEVL